RGPGACATSRRPRSHNGVGWGRSVSSWRFVAGPETNRDAGALAVRMAATAPATGAQVRAFHGDRGGGLRGSRAKTTIFPLPLRTRFSFDGDYVRRLIAEHPE